MGVLQTWAWSPKQPTTTQVSFRDVLGATDELLVDSGNGARVTILDVGRATRELSTPEQVDLIARVEVGCRASPKIRMAFEVSDAKVATPGIERRDPSERTLGSQLSRAESGTPSMRAGTAYSQEPPRRSGRRRPRRPSCAYQRSFVRPALGALETWTKVGATIRTRRRRR